VALTKFCAMGPPLFARLLCSSQLAAQTALSSKTAPIPADPYPLNAAGWGPELANGLLASRWAEDWTGMRAAGHAPPLKAMPIGNEASLTLSGEARLRYDSFSNAQLVRGDDYQQGLLRGVVGADLRLNPHVRVYSEVGTGQVKGRRAAANANMQNDAALQQFSSTFALMSVRLCWGPCWVARNSPMALDNCSASATVPTCIAVGTACVCTAMDKRPALAPMTCASPA